MWYIKSTQITEYIYAYMYLYARLIWLFIEIDLPKTLKWRKSDCKQTDFSINVKIFNYILFNFFIFLNARMSIKWNYLIWIIGTQLERAERKNYNSGKKSLFSHLTWRLFQGTLCQVNVSQSNLTIVLICICRFDIPMLYLDTMLNMAKM